MPYSRSAAEESRPRVRQRIACEAGAKNANDAVAKGTKARATWSRKRQRMTGSGLRDESDRSLSQAFQIRRQRPSAPQSALAEGGIELPCSATPCRALFTGNRSNARPSAPGLRTENGEARGWGPALSGSGARSERPSGPWRLLRSWPWRRPFASRERSLWTATRTGTVGPRLQGERLGPSGA